MTIKALVATGHDAHADKFSEYLQRLPYARYGLKTPVVVERARDGLAAIRRLQSGKAAGAPHQLLISAFRLPGMPGVAILEFTRSDADFSSLLAFLYGADVSPAQKGQARNAAVSAILAMPLSYERFLEELTGAVDRMIEKENRVRGLALSQFHGASGYEESLDAAETIYQYSMKRLQRWLRIAPWSAEGMKSLASVYIGMNRYEKAIAPLKQALAENFANPLVHEMLATCYKRLGKSRGSVAELEVAVRKNDRSSQLRQQLGEAYLQEGDYAKARDAFMTAIRLSPESGPPRQRARSHVGVGESYLAEAEDTRQPSLRPEAARAFAEGRRTDPTLLSAYCGLIRAYQEMGDATNAEAVKSEAMRIVPQEAEDWLCHMRAALMAGEWSKAQLAREKALAFDPEDQIVMVEAARINMRQGMMEEAVDLLRRAVAVNPSDRRIYNFMGICHRKMKQYDEGIAAYDRALAIAPVDASIHFNKGRILEDAGRVDAAVAAYREAVACDADLDIAREAIARLAPATS